MKAERTASIAELEKEGWYAPKGVTGRDWYPNAAEIILVKGDMALRHVYPISDDSSEFPQRLDSVWWALGHIEEVTIRRFKVGPKP